MDYSNYTRYKKTILVLLYTALSCYAFPANAAAIVNLTDAAQTIEVETSNGYDSRMIAAGGKAEFLGAVKVRVHGNETRIADDEEYAIWPNNVFGPQKKYRLNGN